MHSVETHASTGPHLVELTYDRILSPIVRPTIAAGIAKGTARSLSSSSIRTIPIPPAFLTTKLFAGLDSEGLPEWWQTRTFPLALVLFKELSKQKLKKEEINNKTVHEQLPII